jgi:tripartite-type tricarboxylate transporter receptor subunit TctC
MHNRQSYIPAVKIVLTMLLGMFANLMNISAVRAQYFPDHAIRFIVPFPPGGSTDIAARIIEPYLKAGFGQSVVIENKPGAAGQLGVQEMLKAAPDGHTVVLASPGSTAINNNFRNLGYDPTTDLAPLAIVGTVPTAFAVHPDVPAATIAEFIRYAKANPNKLNYAISGIGSQIHLAAELFVVRSGVKMQAVPFNGTQPATLALLSGHVQAAVSDLATLLPFAAEKKLRILAVVDAERAAMAPEIPTMAESGFPGFVASGWVMLFASSKTPRPILSRWNSELQEVLKRPQVVTALTTGGMGVSIVSLSQAEQFHQNELKKWRDVIETAKIVIK